MADISMCSDALCPSAKHCKRSEISGTIPDRFMQTYTDFERKPEIEKCSAYWEINHD